METKRSKREQTLKGGLNALLGGPKMVQEEAAAPGKVTFKEGTPQEEDELIETITDEELKAKLHRRQMQKRGRPRKDEAERVKESEIYKRTTWIMRKDLLAKLKEISFQETLTLKEILEQIVSDAVAKYEKKHGEVIPMDHHGSPSDLFK